MFSSRPKNSRWRPRKLSNISLTGRVGNLHRLQGRLFPHSNTGTVQEILEISCPGPDLSIQSSTVWPVHSALGVHCHSKEVKLMAIQKGPPVPRRLVGESHIPPGMPPAYTGFSENVPGSWLDGEHRKVGTRPKTNLQLCLLPVRPPVRSGLSDSGPVAESTGKNTGTPFPPDLFGEGVHVPDRLVNSHRKTSSPRQVTHEAHSMAPQEQLADSRMPREKNPSAQIFTSPPTVVAEGKQCPHRTTITPNTACSASLYRRIKRRVGRSLKRVHCQKNLVSTRKQATHKLPRTQGSVSSLKRIPRSMHGQDGSGSIRQYHGSSLHQQRGRHEVWSTLCHTMENLNLVYKQAGHPEGTTHPRSPKCSGRQIVQTGTDHSNRMVPSSTSFSTDLQKVAPTSDRSLCNKIQQQASPLCFTGSRPQGLCYRCTQPTLGRPGCLYLPTDSHIGQSGGETTGLPSQKPNSRCSGVTQHDLVLGSGGDVQPDPSTLASSTQPPNSALQSDPSHKSVKPESPCMAPRATLIKKRGFSEAVATRIEAPQRGSTRSVYEAKWTIFTKWCLSNQVDFRSPPVKSVADSLLYLFQDRKL